MNTYQLSLCPTDNKNAGYIEDVKTMEINANGEYSVRPDDGYQGLAGVDLSVNSVYWKIPGNMRLDYGSSIKELNFEGVDFSNVTSLYNFINSFQSLTKLSFKNCDLSTVINMGSIYNNTYYIEYMDWSNTNTINCTNFESIFSGVRLRTLKIDNFQTPSAENFKNMFRESKIEELDLSSFRTEKVKNVDYMFYDCSHTKKIDMRNFSLPLVSDAENMFRYGISSLKEVNLSNSDDHTQQLILAQLRKQSSSFTLGDDGIIRRS